MKRFRIIKQFNRYHIKQKMFLFGWCRLYHKEITFSSFKNAKDIVVALNDESILGDLNEKPTNQTEEIVYETP